MSLEIYKDSSFFKILYDHPSSELWIPIAFMSKYCEILSQEAFLTTDEEYGKCWKVKITQLDNGRFCFADGWLEFVKDNPQISEQDFAVFKLVDASTFHVSIFGKDGVKKPFSSSSRHPSSSTHQDAVRDNNKKGKAPIVHKETKSSRLLQMKQRNKTGETYYNDDEEAEDNMMSFSAILTTHHQYCMNIPMEFAKKTGIINRSYVTLRNEDGESAEVRVTIRRKDGRVCMRNDWNDYWVKNKFGVGNEVTFTIIGDDFGTLHVSRVGFITPTMPKKPTGRPRKYK